MEYIIVKTMDAIDSDIIITCATQNEMYQNDIKYLLKSVINT